MDVRQYAIQEARRQGVDPNHILPLIGVESSWNPQAVSPKGAGGLMQLMPATARDLGLSDADRFNPAKAIPAGIRYYKQQLDRFGNRELALAAYNAGPTKVIRSGGVPNIRETQDYVRKNMANDDDVMAGFGDYMKAKKSTQPMPDNDVMAGFGDYMKQKRANSLKPIDKTVPTADDVTGGAVEGLLAGIGRGMIAPYHGVRQILGLDSQQVVDARKKLEAPLLSTTRGKVGGVLGSIAAAAPTALIPGANTATGAGLIGAIQGALEPVGTGESRYHNTVLGAAGGVIGREAGNIAGRLVKPVRSALSQEQARLVAKAKQLGIQLTPAQLTGSKPLQVLDSVLANLPFSAGQIKKIRIAQQEAINRKVADSIGEAANALSPDVIDSAHQRIGSEFRRLAANNKVKLDGAFFGSIDDVARNHAQLTPHMQNSNVLGLADDLRNLAAAGEIDGSTYQVMRSKLTKDANGAYQAGNSYLGEALKGFRNALDDAAGRSISNVDKAAWDTARRQYANLKTITNKGQVIDEVGDVKLGTLASTVRNRNKGDYARGKAGDLDAVARVAKALVRDPVPDSGTAQRAFWNGLLTGGTGIAGMAGVLNPYHLAMVPVPWMVSKAIHSNAGRKYLTQGLIGQSSFLNNPALQRQMLNAARTGGAMGLLSATSE